MAALIGRNTFRRTRRCNKHFPRNRWGPDIVLGGVERRATDFRVDPFRRSSLHVVLPSPRRCSFRDRLLFLSLGLAHETSPTDEARARACEERSEGGEVTVFPSESRGYSSIAGRTSSFIVSRSDVNENARPTSVQILHISRRSQRQLLRNPPRLSRLHLNRFCPLSPLRSSFSWQHPPRFLLLYLSLLSPSSPPTIRFSRFWKTLLSKERCFPSA